MQPRILGRLREARPTLSFEFFPPKSDAGRLQLWDTIEQVAAIEPDFVSVTFGAGGGGQERRAATLGVLRHIAATTRLTAVAHLTCVGLTRAELTSIVEELGDMGITTILALRGDPPPGRQWTQVDGGLTYAQELIELIGATGNFEVGVAAFPYGHPEARDLDADARVLARKQSAGAGFAITQMFFDPQAYRRMMQRFERAGVHMPVVAGIMPPTRMGQIGRLEGFAGASLPPALATRLEGCTSDEEVGEVGVEWGVRIGRELLDRGAPGLHFYTLNRSLATVEIAQALGLGGAGSAPTGRPDRD